MMFVYIVPTRKISVRIGYNLNIFKFKKKIKITTHEDVTYLYIHCRDRNKTAIIRRESACTPSCCVYS